MARISDRFTGGGSGGTGDGDDSETSRSSDDPSRPTGVAGPEDTPEPAPDPSDDDDDDSGGGGRRSRRERRRDRRRDRQADRPTGIAGPEDTPEPAPEPEPSPDQQPTDRPTGVAGPEDTPEPAPEPAEEGFVRAVEQTPGGGRTARSTDRRPRERPDEDFPVAEAISRAEVDPEIAASLTASEGLLSERRERQARGILAESEEFKRGIERGGLPFDTEDPTQPVSDEGLGERALEGAATAGVDLLTAPVSGALLADLGVEAASRTPATVEEFGVGPTAATVGAAGVKAAESVGESVVAEARADPVRFGAGLGFDVVVGAGAGRAIERGADATRTFGVERRATGRVDFEDVTSERGAAGGLPEFETSPDAPTEEAVREVRERAADQPGDVTEAAGEESVLFHSTEADLPSDLTAERGGSELPGLFAAPDASPLRLDVGDERSLSDVRPRLPRLRGRRDQLVGLPGERVEGMPAGAVGSGRIFDPDAGEFVPDPETSGARFLESEADPGTAFVRPTGSRTTELEAIFPPGSRFAESGQAAVRVGERSVPLRFFERADADLSERVGAGGVSSRGAVSSTDLPSSRLTPRRRGQPVVPTGLGGGTQGDTTTGTGRTDGGDFADVFGGPSEPGGGARDGGPTGGGGTDLVDDFTDGGPTGGGTGPSGGGPSATGPTFMPPPSSPPPSAPPTGFEIGTTIPDIGPPSESVGAGAGESGVPGLPRESLGGRGRSDLEFEDEPPRREDDLFAFLAADETFASGLASGEELFELAEQGR